MGYKWKSPAWARYYTSMNVAKTGFVIHHAMAFSLESIAATFQTRQASAQWGVAPGWVQQYVPANAYAWHCGNTWGNTYLEGIECINSSGAPGWPVSDATVNTLVEFLVDRCKARGIKALYTSGAGKNLYGHQELSATGCPGVLQRRLPEIADRVNQLLKGEHKFTGIRYSGPDRYGTCNVIRNAVKKNSIIMSTKGYAFPDALTGMWRAGQLQAGIEFKEDVLTFTGGVYKNGFYCGGNDRFATNKIFTETHEALFKANPGKECFIVLANNFPDGVACAPISYNRGMPIVFWDGGSKEFYSFINRFTKKYVVGSDVPKISGETRLAGANRFETAVKVAKHFATNTEWLNICSGHGFADGIAAAQMVGNAPMVFAEGQETIEYAKSLKGKVKNIVVFGSEAAVSNKTAVNIAKACGLM